MIIVHEKDEENERQTTKRGRDTYFERQRQRAKRSWIESPCRMGPQVRVARGGEVQGSMMGRRCFPLKQQVASELQYEGDVAVCTQSPRASLVSSCSALPLEERKGRRIRRCIYWGIFTIFIETRKETGLEYEYVIKKVA